MRGEREDPGQAQKRDWIGSCMVEGVSSPARERMVDPWIGGVMDCLRTVLPLQSGSATPLTITMMIGPELLW